MFQALPICRDLDTQLSLLADNLMEVVGLIKTDDLIEMVEASLMLEDHSFFLMETWNWEGCEPVRAVSQWEDATYQVLSGYVPPFIRFDH